MIDAHTHLDSLRDLSAAEAMAAAHAAGVDSVLSIGCGPESIRTTLQIARELQGVRVAAGVHPNQAASFDLSEWPQVCELARNELVGAVGETGFDQYRDHSTLDQQQTLFELHCTLARELDLPLVIHTRAAERHTLDQLAEHAEGLTVILHCFSLHEHLDEVLERGYVCSFAGNVTYGSAQDLRDAAARIPADRLLVETDAPYLSPVPHRGRPNQPAYVAHTARVVADARGETLDQLAAATTANAQRLFGFAG